MSVSVYSPTCIDRIDLHAHLHNTYMLYLPERTVHLSLLLKTRSRALLKVHSRYILYTTLLPCTYMSMAIISDHVHEVGGVMVSVVLYSTVWLLSTQIMICLVVLVVF